MIKIGITGQSGFIGTHLFNFFGLMKEEVTRVPFEDSFFDTEEKLDSFARECGVIIHLAALNRHNNQDTIYRTNILLVEKLIAALERTGSRPHILFASSTQEEKDNIFGKSKREGREKLAEWAYRNNARFTGLIIPNVFGPFGHPYYNSVVATFSHQLTHGETPRIETDAPLKMIYINDLVRVIYSVIAGKVTDSQYRIKNTAEITVSSLLSKLGKFRELYFDNGIFPDLSDDMDRELFSTFMCYIDHEKHFPVRLKKNSDDRGSFTEILKLYSRGQVSFSDTKPGITRGNHFHTRKLERFAVIKGRALIQLRRTGTDKVFNFELDGDNPSFVDMPVWYTHNITNTGSEDLYTLFWTNELFDPADPDTYFEAV